MKKIDKIILGIDPGTTIMGFGLIKVMNKKMELIEMDELKLVKIVDHYVRLNDFETIKLIDKHKPDEISIEAPFFGKTLIYAKVGKSTGVAMAAGLSRQIGARIFTKEN